MGLLQQACATYDAFASLAGVVLEDQAPLAPIGHIVTSAKIEISLDADGSFLAARAVGKDEPKIIIPVTEDSAGRTSTPSPHPLCEQLGYLKHDDPKKYPLYIDLLSDWAQSPYTDPKLCAVLTYVQSGTILNDLQSAAVIDLEKNDFSKYEKDMVRWVVNGLGVERSGPCWTDRVLFDSFIHYFAQRQAGADVRLCMLSGQSEVAAQQHPKGIIPINGNAKLISANDSANFTYLGRFRADWQAASVGYIASQKAHSALRWLIANQGIRIALPGTQAYSFAADGHEQTVFGGRTFLCWNPQGLPQPSLTGSVSRRLLEKQAAPLQPSAYREALGKALAGWKSILPTNAGVVIAAFDAATTGRLALTYYNELRDSDFLERLFAWDLSCCWPNGKFGVQAPTLYHIANFAYGTDRGNRFETDDRILRQQMQRLIACRVDRVRFPRDICLRLIERAARLVLYENNVGENLLFTACAVIRKVHLDYFKEEIDMALDVNNTNRSYLFGRLLAIADAVERAAFDRGETRQTNAMRMQAIFSQQPLYAWRILEERLTPYYAKLNPGLRQYFMKQVQEIVDQLPVDEEQLKKKLDDIYLIGFYHQRAYRAEKKNVDNAEEE